MASTKDRIAKLARAYLDSEREPVFDRDFSDSDISSMDAMAFIKSISSEFNVDIKPEDIADLKNLNEIVSYVDANA